MIRQELYLSNPWINAAGTMGYTPPPRWSVPGFEVREMGAFVTNPVSLGPRTPAAERAGLAYPGGALLHSGLPNPGLSRVLKKYAVRWAQSSLPVWVHLIGSRPEEIYQMVRRLEGVEGVMAIELGIAPDSRPEESLVLIEAAFGELPLVVHLPLDMAKESWLSGIARHAVSAISLGAPRGLLVNERGHPAGGRLYGPALLPQMLAAVQVVRRLGIPVIAGAGIYRRQDVQSALDQGAFAAQLDTVLWRGWLP